MGRQLGSAGAFRPDQTTGPESGVEPASFTCPKVFLFGNAWAATFSCHHSEEISKPKVFMLHASPCH